LVWNASLEPFSDPALVRSIVPLLRCSQTRRPEALLAAGSWRNELADRKVIEKAPKK